MTLLPILLLALGCAWHPPRETPALVAAEGPVEVVRTPAGEPLRVALRAGSAHDPSGREGLAWVTAHAVAAEAGARVEVGPEIVVFTVSPERAGALAEALATAPSEARVAEARVAAAAALEALDCAAVAERAWDAWVYAGHPYGHAPEGRLSVLPTLTAAEVAGFLGERYVRSVAVLGVPAGDPVDAAAFERLPPRLSRSPTPARSIAPEGRVLVVRAPDRRCLVAGHPGEADAADALAAAAFAPGDVVGAARREPRRVVRLPIPPDRAPEGLVAEVLTGGWLPMWQASRALAPEATIPAARPLADVLLARHPYPSLARPAGAPPTVADVRTPAPADLEARLGAWLTPDEVRVVVVLPEGASADFESRRAADVQLVATFPELFR